MARVFALLSAVLGLVHAERQRRTWAATPSYTAGELAKGWAQERYVMDRSHEYTNDENTWYDHPGSCPTHKYLQHQLMPARIAGTGNTECTFSSERTLVGDLDHQAQQDGTAPVGGLNTQSTTADLNYMAHSEGAQNPIMYYAKWKGTTAGATRPYLTPATNADAGGALAGPTGSQAPPSSMGYIQ
jgi:hypothetical protein